MATFHRRLLTLLTAIAVALATGCGKSEPTKGGPPEGYQGSKGGPNGSGPPPAPGGTTPTKP